MRKSAKTTAAKYVDLCLFKNGDLLRRWKKSSRLNMWKINDFQQFLAIFAASDSESEGELVLHEWILPKKAFYLQFAYAVPPAILRQKH